MQKKFSFCLPISVITQLLHLSYKEYQNRAEAGWVGRGGDLCILANI